MATKVHEKCVVLHDVVQGLLLKSNLLRKSIPPCVENAEWAKVHALSKKKNKDRGLI
jgi:hypothetical protein